MPRKLPKQIDAFLWDLRTQSHPELKCTLLDSLDSKAVLDYVFHSERPLPFGLLRYWIVKMIQIADESEGRMLLAGNKMNSKDLKDIWSKVFTPDKFRTWFFSIPDFDRVELILAFTAHFQTEIDRRCLEYTERQTKIQRDMETDKELMKECIGQSFIFHSDYFTFVGPNEKGFLIKRHDEETQYSIGVKETMYSRLTQIPHLTKNWIASRQFYYSFSTLDFRQVLTRTAIIRKAGSLFRPSCLDGFGVYTVFPSDISVDIYDGDGTKTRLLKEMHRFIDAVKSAKLVLEFDDFVTDFGGYFCLGTKNARITIQSMANDLAEAQISILTNLPRILSELTAGYLETPRWVESEFSLRDSSGNWIF